MDTFDPALLRNLETLSLTEARSICLDIVSETKTKAIKKAALIRDVNAAPSSAELSRIMWNIMLAGEGLATTNSAWQQMYGK